MNRIAKISLCGLTLAASLVIAAGAVHAQAGTDPPNVNPTHYWSYQLHPPVPVPAIPIHIQDQFFRQPTPLQVMQLDRLVNWVQKNSTIAPTDTFTHYTWWDVQPKLPMPVPVILTNQFGQFQAQVDHVEFLLTPAWKNQPQPILPHANHYLCYAATATPQPPIGPYFLQDEWRQDQLPVYQLQYLCTPCLKEHLGNVYPPVDTVTHLAVYQVPANSEVFYPFIQDQFTQGNQFVQQQPLEYLFVPTDKKLIVTDTKKQTWGRLKTLYR